MLQMMFENVDGRPMPAMPYDPDRTPRNADGVRYFTLDQAVEHFGRSKESLTKDWASVWGGAVDLNPPGPVGNPAELFAPPASGESTAAAPPGAIDAQTKHDIIHLVRFPHLSAEQYAFIADDCRRRGLDPRLVWVRVERNDETGRDEVQSITTIHALRKLGDSTGKRVHESLPEYCGKDGVWKPSPWLADEPPEAARVLLEVKGSGRLVEGLASWKRCAQYKAYQPGKAPELQEHWKPENGGAEQLGKCAAADAHRRAFPDACDKLYTTDEIPVSGPSARRGDAAVTGGIRPGEAVDPGTGEVVTVDASLRATSLAAPAPSDDPRAALALVDETTPDSRVSLMRELLNMDVGNRAQCEALIEMFRPKLPRLYRDHYQLFCATVIDALRKYPAAYGVPEPAAV